MNSHKITEFLNEIDKLASGKPNKRSTIFANRVREVVNAAYKAQYDDNWKKTGEYKVRGDTANADALVEMGATEAVYGRGRSLLH